MTESARRFLLGTFFQASLVFAITTLVNMSEVLKVCHDKYCRLINIGTAKEGSPRINSLAYSSPASGTKNENL